MRDTQTKQNRQNRQARHSDQTPQLLHTSPLRSPPGSRPTEAPASDQMPWNSLPTAAASLGGHSSECGNAPTLGSSSDGSDSIAVSQQHTQHTGRFLWPFCDFFFFFFFSPTTPRDPQQNAKFGTCLLHEFETRWRNGSASDSRSEGYVFESRTGHDLFFCKYLIFCN